MTPLTRARVPSGTLLLGVLAAIVLGAALLMYAEKPPASLFGAQLDRRPSPLLAGMLTSLGGVMVSLILPARLGRVVLVMGAAVFFAILAYALLSGVQL